MREKDISLEDYACVLARMYAILNTRNNGGLLGPNPFKDELKKELQAIHKFMDNYKCREADVIDRVRQLVPDSDWDNKFRKLARQVGESLDDPNANWKDLNKKIEMYTKSDWKERETLEDLYDLE